MLREKRIRWGWKAVLVVSVFLFLGCGSISGTVSSGGAALPGVTVALTGDASTTTTTDACGNYRFAFLPKGTYTVTPSLTGYSFTPSDQSVTITKAAITGVNFDGIPSSITYSISGTVTSNSVPLPSVTVEITGAATLSTTTDGSGNYQFTSLSSGDYTIMPPSVPGYGFTPANQSVTVSASDITGVSFDATPNTAWAWGLNMCGQLGDGNDVNTLPPFTPWSTIPVQVVLNLTGPQYLTEVIAVSCGWQHTLALRADGTVWAWGQGVSGQLGDGLGMDRVLPVQVSATWGSIKAKAIAAGAYHSLALLEDGTVWAWGDGSVGRLGDGSTTQKNAPGPVTVTWGSQKVVAIAAGFSHSLILLDDGTVWGWGDNGFGKLGDGSTAQSNVPVQAQGLIGVTAIACGMDHSMAIGSGGTIWTWGYNFYGQLGRDTGGVDFSPTPGQVQVAGDFASISGGEGHTIAVKSEGTVWAWGLNDQGQLGDGTNNWSNAPVPVTGGLSGVVDVAAGRNYSVAVGSNGTVWTWGQNTSGQLGDGDIINRNTPFQVPLMNIKEISAGELHTAVVKSP